jgi:hypothetical protein
MDGKFLVLEIRRDRGSVIDDKGRSYWPETIDVSKRYRVRKYERCRALQYYPVVSYKIEEIKL